MSREPVRTTALALGLALAALVLAPPVAATADSSGPQLSIAIDDGETSAEVGDTLTHVITVDNLGSSRVENLRVSQSMPDGVVLVSANHQGVEKAAGVSWSVDLAPGGQATMRTTSRVGHTPVDLLRLASVACAAVTPTASAVVCASDSDELAAGATARLSAVPDDQEGTSDTEAPGMATPVVVGLAALVLLIAAGLGTLAYRSRGGYAATR